MERLSRYLSLRKPACKGGTNGTKVLAPMSESVRTIEVCPPSRSREDFYVMIACSAVMLASLGWILATRPEPGASVDALPYQVAFQDLPSPEQRTLRELGDGFAEAKRVRESRGAWPPVVRLADDGVPPFAPDVLSRAGYRWSSRQDGFMVNYLGLAGTAENPDFVLLIQEPAPLGGEKAQAGVVDEEHQLLRDGRLLHVTYWKRAHAAPPAGMVTRPEVEGWTQVRLGSSGQQ